MNISLFFGGIAVYFFGAVSALLLHRKDQLCTYVSFYSSVLASIPGIMFSYSVLSGDNFIYASNGFLNYSFYVDKLAAFFIFLISITVFAVSIYSTGYVLEYFGKKNIGYIGFLYNMFIISMILVISSNNVVMFLVVWELMSIISYLLVMFEDEKKDTRKAGFIYIVMTHAGTGFIILSFLILAGLSESFNFDSFRGIGSTMPSGLKDMVFILALIGFGTKAGIVPLHIWLPYAHPAAPGNISALMSGVMIKTAIFMMIRVFFDFLGADALWWGMLLLIIASVSALLGVMYALIEHDIKRLLAYHSVENIGIILIGVSLSMIFKAQGFYDLAAFGLIAGLYHTINHALFKSLLFLGAGSLTYSTHTRNIEEYGGLIKKMPYTAFFFLIGAVSISALPPFNGFVSEWLTFHTQLLSINLSDNIIKIFILFSGAGLALTGALAAVCFVKAFGISFLALPRSSHAENSKEVPFSMLAGMLILSVMCFILGVLPFYMMGIIDSISSQLLGINIITRIYSDLSISALSASLSTSAATVSTAWIAVLVFVVLPLPVIVYLLTDRHRVEEYETWGCGQPFSTGRNEYTATAFSKPIRIWFGSIFRPHREIHTAYGDSHFFKEKVTFESEIEPVFEKYLYDPIIWIVVTVSRMMKIIQTGYIHSYLLYILITLVIALIYVGSGG